MHLVANPAEECVVQIVGPTDNWVLERLARRLAAKLPYAEFVPWQPRPCSTARLAYYVNYALYQRPSGLLDVGFFTHRDDTQRFLERAWAMDCCVCMSRQYADWLKGQGVHTVVHISMGFDAYRYRPRLVLGVVGRLDHPRKGGHLVERLRQLPFVDVQVTDGHVAATQLADFYQGIDYVLITATVEGGPLCLLEGLAMGKPVLAPTGVGMVPEFDDTVSIRRYPAGDAEALVQLVTECYEQKCRSSRMVQARTWDRWAEDHHRVFAEILRSRGLPVPEPAPAFRFGLLGEVNVPLGIDIEPIENAVDQAAAHLFYGRVEPARAVLEDAVRTYPFLAELRDSLPLASSGPAVPRPITALQATVPPASTLASTQAPSASPEPSRSEPALSLIVAVLESYEVVRRQLLHLERILTPDCELILVDDGSVPSLEATCASVPRTFRFTLHRTGDRRPWTQPRARNIGADLARATKLLFFDIDHIVTPEIIAQCLTYTGDKLHWVRRPGILDAEGKVVTDKDTLRGHGLTDQAEGVHPNSFLIRKALFQRLGGYDERFCGRYGGDDLDFNRRYDQLCQQGVARPAEVQGAGYFFPDPAYVPELFHSLRRTVGSGHPPVDSDENMPNPAPLFVSATGGDSSKTPPSSAEVYR
jgi:hypothetical protein